MLFVWGILLIALGAGINRWTLARLLYPDGNIRHMPPQALVYTASGILIGWGLLTILLRRFVLVKKLNLALFSLMVMAPVAGEISLRASFAFEGSPTRKPDLYDSYAGTDDYWKLTWKWGKHDLAREKELTHPLLGWSQAKVEPRNPLGLYDFTLEQLKENDGKRRVLFYGDSYVGGCGDFEHRLPKYTNKLMPDVSIVDLGAGGFGVDQIYLMLRETWRMGGPNPFIIFGILTEDLDRSILSFRTAPKPRFRLDAGGALTLDPEPLPRDPEEWLAAHPIGIKSYLVALAAHKLRTRGYDPRVEQKKVLNRSIIEATHDLVKREGLDCVVVLFYGPWALRRVEWKETFLKEELEKRAIPYVDTKAAILEYCKRTNTDASALYTPVDGHHNNLGNEVVGDAIVAHLKGRLAGAESRK
jgi:hypothetical protein